MGGLAQRTERGGSGHRPDRRCPFIDPSASALHRPAGHAAGEGGIKAPLQLVQRAGVDL